ncbi:MAG: hybrid sensor histidine kinase/response regulator [Chloroflexota bacterium]
MQQTERQHSNILIVDDEATNLRILYDILKMNDYQVHALRDSREVFNAVQRVQPNLILLDIHMPHLNGFEIAKSIKEDSESGDIPIIFISASHEDSDIQYGFGLGAVDYITKPIKPYEVLARVSAHLRLRHQQLELEEKIDEIQRMREREKQQFAEITEIRNQFIQSATHDLKNPLYTIVGYVDLIKEMGSQLSSEQLILFQEHIELSTDKMSRLISDILDLIRVESANLHLDLRLVDFGTYLNKQLSLFELRASQEQIRLNLEHADEHIHLLIDPDLFSRVIDNLISNAIKYSPEKTDIIVRYYQSESGIHLEVEDYGYGMSEDVIVNLFTPFFRSPSMADKNIEGTGLGMAVTKEIVERHDGTITVKSQVGSGSLISILIPYKELSDTV